MIQRTLIIALAAALILGSLTVSAPAIAQDKDVPRDFVDKDSRSRSGATVSLEQAVSDVRRTYGGEVLGAETRGNTHYVKILSENGRVKTVKVDARTGRMR